jgi:hypothetical protein
VTGLIDIVDNQTTGLTMQKKQETIKLFKLLRYLQALASFSRVHLAQGRGRSMT